MPWRIAKLSEHRWVRGLLAWNPPVRCRSMIDGTETTHVGLPNQSLLILLSIRRFRAIAGGKKIYQQRVPNELPGDMPEKMSGYMLNRRYARKMLGNIPRKMLRRYVGKKIRMSKKCHNICQKETHKACPKIGGKICQKNCQERMPGNMPEKTSKRYVTKMSK